MMAKVLVVWRQSLGDLETFCHFLEHDHAKMALAEPELLRFNNSRA